MIKDLAFMTCLRTLLFWLAEGPCFYELPQNLACMTYLGTVLVWLCNDLSFITCLVPCFNPFAFVPCYLSTGISFRSKIAFPQLLSWLKLIPLPLCPLQFQTLSTTAACLSAWPLDLSLESILTYLSIDLVLTKLVPASWPWILRKSQAYNYREIAQISQTKSR